MDPYPFFKLLSEKDIQSIHYHLDHLVGQFMMINRPSCPDDSEQLMNDVIRAIANGFEDFVAIGRPFMVAQMFQSEAWKWHFVPVTRMPLIDNDWLVKTKQVAELLAGSDRESRRNNLGHLEVISAVCQAEHEQEVVSHKSWAKHLIEKSNNMFRDFMKLYMFVADAKNEYSNKNILPIVLTLQQMGIKPQTLVDNVKMTSQKVQSMLFTPQKSYNKNFDQIEVEPVTLFPTHVIPVKAVHLETETMPISSSMVESIKLENNKTTPKQYKKSKARNSRMKPYEVKPTPFKQLRNNQIKTEPFDGDYQ